MREKAFEIQSLSPPPLKPPSPPVLLPIKSAHAIQWRGAVGASGYDVERVDSLKGPWGIVGAYIDDTLAQYRPLFSDNYAEQGRQYFYRVRAKNAAGASEASNVAGPVKVNTLGFIDHLGDLSKI